MKGIIGKKIGMTQIFDENGRMTPVTVIEAGPCAVVQKKSEDKDGYVSCQLGFKEIADKKATKPQQGHFKKAGLSVSKYLKEFNLTDDLNVGDIIKADVFAAGDKVDITGTSKGKGFAGTIKRHGQSRGPMSHGGGPTHRHAGSMGSGTDPGRIMPGKKQPGHMGNEQITVQNLDIIKVDIENNLLVVKGAVPGNRGGILYIKTSIKA